MKTLKLIFAIAVSLVILALIHSWIAAHHDQVRLRAELAAQKKVIEDANAQEREQSKTLQQSLAQIEELKRKARSPADIVRGINQALDLPKPIMLRSEAANVSIGSLDQHLVKDNYTAAIGAASRLAEDAADSHQHRCNSASTAAPLSYVGSREPSAAKGKSDIAEIPVRDLQPMYDDVLNSRACEEKLRTATSNALDENKKISAVMMERNSAIAAAKGGGKWSRIRQAGLWIGIGVLSGVALTNKLKHHLDF